LKKLLKDVVGLAGIFTCIAGGGVASTSSLRKNCLIGSIIIFIKT